jgi:hypothetical protein
LGIIKNPVQDDGNVLKVDSGDGCTTWQISKNNWFALLKWLRGIVNYTLREEHPSDLRATSSFLLGRALLGKPEALLWLLEISQPLPTEVPPTGIRHSLWLHSPHFA